MAQHVPPTRLARIERGITSFERPRGFPARITDATYAVALRASLRGRNADYIGDILGVPRHVASEWMQTREWARDAASFRDEVRDVDLVAATALSSLAMQRVAQRLEHGDAHVTKSGLVVYKPVNAADAAAIAIRFAERKDQLERQIDGVPEPNTLDALENLFKVANILTAAGEAVQRHKAVEDPDIIDITPEPSDPHSEAA